MSLAVLIPAKPLADVKQRLSPVLVSGQRRRVFEAMLRDLLQQLSQTGEVERVLIVGGDADIQQVAADNDAFWLAERQRENKQSGLNNAVAQGVTALRAAGCRKVLVLHGDLPLAKVNEINELIHSHRATGQQLSLVSDRQGQGTNALLIDTDKDFKFHYGEGSLDRHIREANSRSLRYQSRRYSGIATDIDTPEDLLDLVEALAVSPQQAPLTWMVMRRYRLEIPVLIEEQRVSA
ncbi:2-phospho-L-lactate guanylyltransferase [Sinobacterium caligoides]|uniref:3-phospho-D-glycerate guanylyltransferase n=1 Tax=Sinobacterium caligoides TaxID=933926 RepID=A0A3N2DMW1_9GAMM|nr:2-phospho-L-lactate guanylyltransferase [Sinobacterium caligoides]ROS01151.1 2-phospho-L-lactate guanylyltransferase [Sinobacterium caligoides]